MDKKWKKFEESSFNIVKSLNPQAQVYKNIQIQGQLSKVKRQVDVQLVKPEEYQFIAFECKDHKRPLDVPVVEAFNTKLRDVGAKKGAIVSNSPFTKAAENMASELGIDLLALVDTKNKNVRGKLFASLLLSDTFVKSFRLRLKSSSPKILLPLDIREVVFVNERDQKGTAYEIFALLWNENETSLSREPGVYEYRPPNPKEKRIIGLDGEIIIPDEIVFVYEVVEKHFAGQIEVIETQGLYNVKEKSYQTRSMQTAPIVAYEIEKTWPEIPAEEAIRGRNEGRFSMAVGCSSVLPSKPHQDG